MINNGNINIIRLKKYVGILINFEVFIDNQFVGTLTNGNSLNIPINLGNHMVELKTADKTITQEVVLTENQRNVYIECKCKMGLIVGRPNITNIYYQ